MALPHGATPGVSRPGAHAIASRSRSPSPSGLTHSGLPSLVAKRRHFSDLAVTTAPSSRPILVAPLRPGLGPEACYAGGTLGPGHFSGTSSARVASRPSRPGWSKGGLSVCQAGRAPWWSSPPRRAALRGAQRLLRVRRIRRGAAYCALFSALTITHRGRPGQQSLPSPHSSPTGLLS